MTAQTNLRLAPELDPRSELTIDEATGTLTGYEEIAILKHFGQLWLYLAEHDPMTLTRALIFVLNTRDGANAPDAKDAAMRLPLREVMAYFTAEDEDDELDPMVEDHEPVSESGKDERPPD